jgi:protein involved in polysaccharide export with SLBB domain
MGERVSLPTGDAMSDETSTSTVASLRRRGLLVALFAVAACDSDTTPIVREAAADGGGESLALAPTNTPGGARSRGAAAVPGADYKLGPNDRVRIIVFGQPTLTGEYSLDGNGVLAFPLIGNIPAQGVTTAELQKLIAAKLEPDYLINPSVSAEVVTRRPFYVIGEVHKPGNYPYVTDMTALNAVAMAGGFTYRARKNDFYIKRLDQNGKMVRIQATGGTVLQPGDTLEVRERLF